MKKVWKVIQIILLIAMSIFYVACAYLAGLSLIFFPDWLWLYQAIPFTAIGIIYFFGCEIVRIYKT